MTERTAQLEGALRANQALIVEAQAAIEGYLTKQIDQATLVDRVIRLFDGPEQREAQRLSSKAFGEDFGNNA
jgi:hypothetical protein